MNENDFEQVIIAGLLFGLSAAFGSDVFRKGKRLYRTIRRKVKKAKKLEIPNMKKSLDDTLKYSDYYLPDDCR